MFNPEGESVGIAAGCAVLEGATAYVGFDSCKEPFTNYFLCDGTADDVQINAAEAYATGLGNGTVELERGTYDIADPIIPTGNSIWYRGQGEDTFLDGDSLSTTEHLFHVTGRDDIQISDMSMQTEDGAGKTCYCIFIEDGSDRFKIRNVSIIESDVIIYGTPVYWYGPTALMKAFLDRHVYFNCPENREKIRGKKAIIAVPFEEDNLETAEPLVTMFEKGFKYLEMSLIEKILVPGVGDKGDILKKQNILVKDYKLGKKIAK